MILKSQRSKVHHIHVRLISRAPNVYTFRSTITNSLFQDIKFCTKACSFHILANMLNFNPVLMTPETSKFQGATFVRAVTWNMYKVCLTQNHSCSRKQRFERLLPVWSHVKNFETFRWFCDNSCSYRISISTHCTDKTRHHTYIWSRYICSWNLISYNAGQNNNNVTPKGTVAAKDPSRKQLLFCDT